ncbi:MAG TPA: peptidoglycan-binding protein [Solirubrobacteraceae bacterium]|nr:peptidoglycan-binding protein [Solirubrobacteraceae bacterium]
MSTRARGAAFAGVAAAAGAAGWAALGGGDGDSGARAASAVRTGTATAQVRRLVDHEDVEGRLGYAGTRTLGAAAGGTLTAIRREATVVRRGQSLYSLDGRPAAFVLYGRVPAYRALSNGVDDGRDVEQLERDLVALGHDPGGAIEVDEEFDAATAAAVKRWEEARGMTEDGVVERGEVVFTRGAVRVGERRAAVGDRLGAGRPVLDVSSRRRVVTARLPAGRQSLVRRGQRVRVTLPDGSTVRGRIAKVGRVARTSQEDGEATVSLVISVRGRRVRLDGAPVTVSIARTTARRALAVPVQALLAVGRGRYAVETGGRLVPVEPGAFADGWVEVRGAGLRDGTTVTVPR